MSVDVEGRHHMPHDQAKPSVLEESQNASLNASVSQNTFDQTWYMSQDTRNKQPNKVQRGTTWMFKRLTLTTMLASMLTGSDQRTRTLHNQL
jgi:hypothetical protein